MHPENKFIWQQALKKVHPDKPDIWYSHKNIRKNPLASFMSELSRNYNLSQIYTNHSIRGTGCTVLTRCSFSYSEIMAISGHKSVQSLAIYQKTKENEKIKMGKALFQSMTKSEDEININKNQKENEAPKKLLALPPPQPAKPIMTIQSEEAVAPKNIIEKNVEAATVPFEANFEDEDISDVDLLSALCGVSEDISMTNAITNTRNVVNAVPKGMFANCHIGAINITINKQGSHMALCRAVQCYYHHKLT